MVARRSLESLDGRSMVHEPAGMSFFSVHNGPQSLTRIMLGVRKIRSQHQSTKGVPVITPAPRSASSWEWWRRRMKPQTAARRAQPVARALPLSTYFHSLVTPVHQPPSLTHFVRQSLADSLSELRADPRALRLLPSLPRLGSLRALVQQSAPSRQLCFVFPPCPTWDPKMVANWASKLASP